ncbi:hypothetical protein AM587_10011346 [Phytophthora nicotianae]|uniref:Neutral zinc metallopeptidase n=1 Tax=Phytophthora nicotianae TaxID=4792 RepID=A0A0W8CVF7_PHYNI|nr:hypothetical protein AM587_10004376 [Phytophthora nicotianae]KUF88334.1 hypothetical protein AM587_10011346 [Phytophthora nicotianae]
MKQNTLQHLIFLLANLAATSSTLDFNGENGVVRATGTVAPTSLGDFGRSVEVINPSTGESVGTGGQGWPSAQSMNEWSQHTGSSGETLFSNQDNWLEPAGSLSPGAETVSAISMMEPVDIIPLASSSSGTNISSAEPTFGQIVSKSGECVVAKPVEYISEEHLDWVWQNRIGPSAKLKKDVNWNVMTNKNFFLDKFVHNNDSINYCVRWDTSTNLKKDIASKFKDVLERHYNKWNKWLEGYNCWPFRKLEVNMVGFAARQASQFDWTDESLGKLYERNLDSDGVPQCPVECYRFYDHVNNMWSDTSACESEPFDVSFWLKEDIPYGYGYDWGQEVSLNDTMNNLYDEDILFIGHEIGHGFGLPDFYGLDSKPARDFPNSIMMAYSSSTITASDGWMLRRVLDHVKPRLKI